MVGPVAQKIKVTSPYGKRTLQGKEQFHDGIDFVSESGRNDVIAIADGIVTYDQDDYEEALRWTDKHHSAGNMVIIRHELEGGLYYVRYLHLVKNIVRAGQKVFEGATFGVYGDVGYSFGPHLHVDVYDMHWRKIDPTPLFKEVLS